MLFDLLNDFRKVIPVQKLHRDVFNVIEKSGGNASVNQIAANTARAQHLVSTSLRKLLKAGFIILGRQEGTHKYYKVAPDIEKKIDALKTLLNADVH